MFENIGKKGENAFSEYCKTWPVLCALINKLKLSFQWPSVHWVHCQTLSNLAYMSAVCVQYLHELYGAGEQHLPVHLLPVHVVQPDHDLDHLVQIDRASSVFVKHFE